MYMSASAPGAPPFSDTTIGCFIRLFFWMAACIIRAIWSEAPPAPAATTISTGLLGSQAARALVANARLTNAGATADFLLMTPPMVFRGRLGGLTGGRLGAARQVLHRRLHTLALHWHAGKLESHLNAGQRAHQREIVEIAKMADAEYLAGQLAEARAERHVERFQNDFANLVGIVSGRRHDRSERARVFARIRREDLESPCAHRAPGRFAVALVACENGIEAFLVEEHLERFAQPIEEIGRRRVRKVALIAVREHLVPRPVAARQLRALRRFERLGRDAVERQPRRQHQALLRSRHRNVDAPLVVAIVERGER